MMLFTGKVGKDYLLRDVLKWRGIFLNMLVGRKPALSQDKMQLVGDKRLQQTNTIQDNVSNCMHKVVAEIESYFRDRQLSHRCTK